MASDKVKADKKKPASVTMPSKLTFKAWRDKFDKLLGRGEPSWKALTKWVESVERLRQSDRVMREHNPVPKREYNADPRTETLESLYRETCPPDLEPVRVRQKHAEDVLDVLETLAIQSENFVNRLRKDGVMIEMDGGFSSVDLTPLVEQYDTAVRDSRYIISLVKQPYTHDSNLVFQCVPLYMRLSPEYS